MRILSILGNINTVFPAVAVKNSARATRESGLMRRSMRIIFALMLSPALAWAPLLASADAGGTSSVDLNLHLSTDVGENATEARTATVVPEPVAQGVRPQPSGEAVDSYRIDTGDGISVTVYGEPDLSIKDERVKGDGKISFPLLGDIQVRGRSASELQRLISELLSDGYLKKPNVTVSIDTFRLFYIKGEVRNPGGFNYVDGLTVEKAVALAGGYTDRASERNITVVRDSDPGQRARQAMPATRIRPGDVITVGESFF